MRFYKIVSQDGEFIASVTVKQRNRLLGLTEDGHAPRYSELRSEQYPKGEPIYNPRLVRGHRKNSRIYFALVDPSIIWAEIRREISQRVPVAEDNTTIRRCTTTAPNGQPIRYIEHNDNRSYAYLTTAASLEEHVRRFLERQKQTENVCLPTQKADSFPLHDKP